MKNTPTKNRDNQGRKSGVKRSKKIKTSDYYSLCCDAEHPVLDGIVCEEWGEHTRHRNGSFSWNDPTALAEFEDLRARDTDPYGSHAAAARDFDIPQGAKGMKKDILEVLIAQEAMHPDQPWLTCREIAEVIYGPGPYTYDQAVGINKVQTIALKLYREGLLNRQERFDNRLRYSIGGSN